MKLILLQNVDNLGYKHDVVNVKPGFGRNYLIPQGYAVIANPTNQNKLDKIIADITAKENARLDEYKAMAQKISGQTLKIGVKSGTSGKIFGKVTNVQVVAELKDKFDLDVERKKITLPDDPKEIGTYTAVINFHPEVSETINIELVAE
jgi:large subunit ribosomal protein L9